MNNSVTFFILADGHYNSLGLVRSIGKAGYTPKIFLIGSKNAIVRYSKYAKDITLCRNVDYAINTIITHYSDDDNKKFILTGNDKFVSAIDAHHSQLDDKFITYNSQNSTRLSHLMSKAVQNDLARKAGLNVPEFAVVNIKDGTIPDIPFPVITKAINSIGAHWKDIVYLCRNEQELKQAYDKIECEQIIVQHYIDKDNETGFNGISIDAGNQVYLPLQLTYRTTSETTFGNSIILFKPHDSDLIDKVRALIKSTGYVGSFSVDFIIGKDSKIYFLEINFRNSGWSYPYTCTGVNLPAIWADSMIKGRLDTHRQHIGKTPFTATDEFMELYDNSKKGIRGFLGTLPQIFKSDALIYWDPNDMRPFFHLIGSKIYSHLPFRTSTK